MNKVWLHKNTLVVQFKYSPRILNLIRQVDGRIFNKKFKRWEVPVTSVVQCVDVLRPAGFSFSREVKESYKEMLSRGEKIKRIKEDPGVYKGPLPLYDFQKIGAGFMSELSSSLLAQDTGLGKTLQTIATIDTIKSRRNLIIAPKSLIHNWKSEILKWHPEAKVFVSDGPKEKRKSIYYHAEKYQGVFYLIVGYETARNDIEELS